MEKLEITLQNEVKKISGWELIKNDPIQLDLIKRLKAVEIYQPLTAKDYEEKVLKELKAIQTPMNKYNETYVKPIKRALTAIKDIEVGGFEKQTILKVKSLKKIKEQQAIDLGLIFPVEKETKEFKIKEEIDKITLVRNLINERIELLNKKTNSSKDEINFLNKIYNELGK